MPCYHPLIRVEDKTKKIKAADGHMYNEAKVLKAGLNELENYTDYENKHYKYEIIPCGKCIGCRLEYSRQWANRGYLEAKSHENNWFATITYDQTHLPMMEEIEDEDGFTYTNTGEWNGTLAPADLTQFIKNVRQIMKRDHNQDGIRFMACGEYGSKGERPHYHIIFFNLDLPIETFFEPKIINKEVYYRNTIIERAWTKGISNISEASWNNIAYTARYITKKINGDGSSQHYAELGQKKEFFRVSRMPGIGEKYFRDHWEEIYKRDEIIIKNKQGSISTQPPKYYDKLLEKEHPKEWEKIKKRRRKKAIENSKLKDETTSLTRLEQLTIEEKTKDEQTQKLIRYFEQTKN